MSDDNDPQPSEPPKASAEPASPPKDEAPEVKLIADPAFMDAITGSAGPGEDSIALTDTDELTE